MEVLMRLCQTGMFLMQWMIIALTSTNLLCGKSKRKAASFWQVGLTGMGLAIISRTLLEITGWIWLNMLLCAGIIVAVNVLFFRDSIKKKLSLSFVEMLTAYVGEIFTAYLLLTTANTRGIPMEYGYESMNPYPEYVVLSNIYATLIFFVVYMIVFVLWRGLADHFWMREYLLYIIVPLYQLILILIYYSSCKALDKIELTTGILLAVFSLVIDFSLVYLVNGMLQKLRVEKELAALYTQRSTEQKYVEIAEQNLEEIEAIRQDMGDRLKAIYDLAGSGDSREKIREMLDFSSDHLKSSAIRRHCENSVVNAILTIKLQSAREKDIAMESECSIPEEMGIEMIDLCSLFTNLIDNAIEACEKIAEKEKRSLSVRAGLRGGYLTVKVENTYAQAPVKEKGRILTSKQDKDNHGYGLKLVEDIVKKYNGNMEITTREEVFKVVASLETTDKK